MLQNGGWTGFFIGFILSTVDFVLDYLLSPRIPWGKLAVQAWLFLTLCIGGYSIGRLFSEVRKLSVTDALTGLYSRYYFFDQLDKELSRAKRYNEPFSIIMMDLDGFKRINDSQGHLAGDRILRAVAAALHSAVRRTDVVGRYGGEEFVLLLPHTDEKGALTLANRLRELIERCNFGAGHGQKGITISGGITTYPTSGTTAEELLERADQALYKAKETTNAVVHYAQIVSEAAATRS